MNPWRTYNGSLLESQYLRKWGETVLKSEPTWTIDTLYLRQNQKQHHHQYINLNYENAINWDITEKKNNTVQESRRTETGLALKYFSFFLRQGLMRAMNSKE